MIFGALFDSNFKFLRDVFENVDFENISVSPRREHDISGAGLSKLSRHLLIFVQKSLPKRLAQKRRKNSFFQHLWTKACVFTFIFVFFLP